MSTRRAALVGALFLLGCALGGSEPAPVPGPGLAAAPAPDPAPPIPGPLKLSVDAPKEPTPPLELDTIWGCCGWALEQVEASSTLAAQGASTYGVEHLGDDDPRTAWVEGAKGDGVGESLSFLWRVHDDMTCDTLGFRNGYQKSPGLYEANGRVKGLEVYVDGVSLGPITLHDTVESQYLYVGAADRQRVRLVIRSVYPGARHQDTALTEAVQICTP